MEGNDGNQCIDELKRDNEALKLKIENLEQSIELLRTSNNALKSSNEILKKNNDLLKRDNETLKNESATLKADIETLEKNNETLTNNNGALETRIEASSKIETAKKDEQLPEMRLKSKLTDDFLKKKRIKKGIEKKREQFIKILTTLNNAGSKQVKELKEEMNVPRSTMTRIVQTLLAGGLIERQGSKRFGAYRLTDEGKKLFK